MELRLQEHREMTLCPTCNTTTPYLKHTFQPADPHCITAPFYQTLFYLLHLFSKKQKKHIHPRVSFERLGFA